jgi:hypothetical protein
MSKKSLFTLLIIAMMIFSAIPALAQSAPTLTIPAEVQGAPGRQVRIPITFDAGGHEIRNIIAAVTYDTAVFSFNAFECSLSVGATPIPCDGNDVGGEVNINIGRR